MKGRVLFVLYDAGETLALLPVLPLLEKAGIEYQLLPIHKSAYSFVKSHEKTIHINQNTLENGAYIDNEYLYSLTTQCQALSPDLVVIGAHYIVQLYISRQFKRRGIAVAGYYDTFSFNEKSPLLEDFFDLLDAYWVPTGFIVEKSKPFNPKADVVVVGHPGVQAWNQVRQEVNLDEVKAQVGLSDETRKIIGFVGGYGTFYPPTVACFFQCIAQRQDVLGLVVPHPGSSKDIERQVLQDYPNITNIKIVDDDVSLLPTCFLFDVLVSRQSTANVQALFCGMPSIYLAKLCENFRQEDLMDSYFVNYGYIPRVHNEDDFWLEVDKMDNYQLDIHNIYEDLQIPQEPNQAIFQQICKMIKRQNA